MDNANFVILLFVIKVYIIVSSVKAPDGIGPASVQEAIAQLLVIEEKLLHLSFLCCFV